MGTRSCCTKYARFPTTWKTFGGRDIQHLRLLIGKQFENAQIRNINDSGTDPHVKLLLLYNCCAAGTFNMLCMYGDTYSKSMDQPGKVANPARGQLNRENDYLFPCLRCLCLRNWSREAVSAAPSRVSLLILHTQAESSIWCLLTGFLPSSAAASIYLF